MEALAYLAAFLLFCLLLLALPVDLNFSLEKEETLKYRAELGLFFGLLSVDVTPKAGRPAAKARPKRRRRTKSRLGSVLGNEASFKRFIRLMRDLRRSFRIRELTLHCRVGLGDPAQTGMLMGVLHPLLLPGRDITLTADFQEAVFEGRCSARIRLLPVQVVGSLLAFAVSERWERRRRGSLREQ
jgi:hypothetical protein